MRILDAQNRLFATFNLTEHNLAFPEERDALKKLFLAAAQIVDADADQLPDEWEQRHFRHTQANAAEDSDGDGRDNFTEFAFGSDPQSVLVIPSVRTSLISVGNQPFFSVTFRRHAGSFLDYVVETSSDLQHWTASASEVAAKGPPRNLYDGTGTSEATYNLVKGVSDQPHKFVRVRVVPRPRQ
ncbi:MAG: hypothetical protein HY735_05705 [Verrucomicrobia bacterium]|nr:hypothetical protein [Verrucomicrobiota bacterium]